MTDWITEDEYSELFTEAEKIFIDYIAQPSAYGLDYWVDVRVGDKVFDLNLFLTDDETVCFCTAHPTSINKEGYRETNTMVSKRLITMELHSYE